MATKQKRLATKDSGSEGAGNNGVGGSSPTSHHSDRPDSRGVDDGDCGSPKGDLNDVNPSGCSVVKPAVAKGASGVAAGDKDAQFNKFRQCVDLIVLGLPYKTDERAMKSYFEQFGKVAMVQV